jgi:glucosamine 6-phosphate synthetase-like amidotransferase/phosphosugar isomerase protein
MCGIVGYIGHQDSKEVLLKGLEKLEYRGYDSAGIAVMNENGVQVFKEKGRIADLRNIVDYDLLANTGIGHTRWATHGKPSQSNAHPHKSNSGRFTLVHNGVIENYEILKSEYLMDIPLVSDTDTEVIVQLMELFVNKGLAVEEAFCQTLKLLKGSYAIAMLDEQNTNVIYVAKNKSPLLVGVGEDFNVVASDAMAMLQTHPPCSMVYGGTSPVTTAFDFPGWETQRTLGTCFGLIVRSMGFTDDEESQKMREQFDKGNAWTLKKLQERFAPQKSATAATTSAGASSTGASR